MVRLTREYIILCVFNGLLKGAAHPMSPETYKCRSSFVYLIRPQLLFRDGRGHGRRVVGFTTTCAISAYHH